MTLLHKLNLPDNVKHATYRYNENDIPITVFIMAFQLQMLWYMDYLLKSVQKWRH